jgi:hypothetical protein
MRIRQIVVGAVVGLALWGCAGPTPAPGSRPELPAASTSPSSSPSASARDVQAVVASDFAPRDASADLDGVEFEVAGTGITCGVYSPHYTDVGPFFGCIAPNATFEWPVVGNDGEDDFIATGIIVRDSKPAAEIWISDATFAPDGTPFGSIGDGSSITWTTVTCTVSETTVDCSDEATGQGFTLSNAAYDLY